MRNEKEVFKKKLDNELNDIRFSKQDVVFKQIHPITWKDKFLAFWNKEVEISVLPASAIVILFFVFGSTGLMMTKLNQLSLEDNQLVEAAGNTYWLHELKREIAKYED